MAQFIYHVHCYLRQSLEYQHLEERRVSRVVHRKIITAFQADEVGPEPCSDCVAPVDQTIKAALG